MAHFAKVTTKGEVQEVLVVDNEALLDENGEEQENLGQAFLLQALGEIEGTWVQTSYNGSFRGTYAAVGGSYDSAVNKFKPRKPYPSWVWNDVDNSWEAPIAKPTILEDAFGFEVETVSWNESSTAWDTTSTPWAHYARYNDSNTFDGTIVSMPIEYILDETSEEDDDLGIILAIDYKGVGDWRRALTPP